MRNVYPNRFVKREYSLKGRKLFKEVIRKGKRFKESGILLIVAKHTSLNEDNNFKIGILIHKKYGKANKRNYTKRQIRAALHPLLPLIQNGYYILRPLDSIHEMPFTELENTIKVLFLKAGVLKGENNI